MIFLSAPLSFSGYRRLVLKLLVGWTDDDDVDVYEQINIMRMMMSEGE